MRITKRQLRRIIRESLNEIGPPPDMSDPDWHPNMSQEWEWQAQSEERRRTEEQTDAYETGYDDAMIGELPDMRSLAEPEAYRAGYEAGLKEQGK